jgi:predicted peptidase
MKITVIIIVLSLTSIFMNCSSTNSSSPNSNEITEATLKLKDNSTLLYSRYISQNYQNKTGLPLIISLHYGWTGNITAYYGKEMLNQLIIPAFGDVGAVIVAPDCPGNSWTDYKSENAVFELIEQMKKEFKIDTTRIAVTGFSLGGIGTWYMLTNYPNQFCAGIVISGMAEEGWISKLKNKPLYVIHSLKDEIFPFLDVQKIINLAEKKDTLLTFVPIAGISHYETEKFLDALESSKPWLKKILNIQN